MPVYIEPEILPVMVGMAGHVDHGKTSLIQLLTGCNTDSLKEEKARGLTIDLGFAPCLVKGNRMVGIIDVPGHIDFIKNMVAGVTSLDILLLVVAADDSIMPQTKEHFQIVKLLRNPLVITVITKIDLVDETLRTLVQEEVRDLLIQSGFPEAPIIPVSNVTFEGINQLRNTLSDFVTIARQQRESTPPSHQAFRMNIARVFSVKGFGTVVTGVPLSGSLKIGDSVELLPFHTTGRIRGVQNYKHSAQLVLPNACNAINISDLDAEQITRGMTIANPDQFQSVLQTVLQISNISSLPIKDEMSARFHSGTASTIAKIMVLGEKSILPGKNGFIQIKLNEGIVLVAGDYFILRGLSPSETIAGGRILSIQNNRYKKSDPSLKIRLEKAMEAIKENDSLFSEMWLAESPLFASNDIIKIAGLDPEYAESAIQEKVKSQKLYDLSNKFYIVIERSKEIINSVITILKIYHNEKIYSWGMDPVALMNELHIPLICTKNFTQFLLDYSEGKIKTKHTKLLLQEFTPHITAKQMKQKEELLQYLIDSNLKVQARGNILTDLNLTTADFKFLIKILIETNEIVQVGNRVYERNIYDQLIQKTLNAFSDKPQLSINDLKEATQLSRNMLIEFGEHLDSKGITKRQGDIRVLLISHPESIQ